MGANVLGGDVGEGIHTDTGRSLLFGENQGETMQREKARSVLLRPHCLGSLEGDTDQGWGSEGLSGESRCYNCAGTMSEFK